MDGDNNTHVKIEMENMNRNAQPFHEICKLIRKTESQYKNLPNHLKEIQSVLERNPNVIFESDNNGRNILHVIASQPERKGEILTVFGFDIEGDYDMFEKYVSKDRLEKLLYMSCGAQKKRPIHTAVENGFILFVNKLVTICPSLIHVQDSDGNTPLHTAAKNSMPEAVECMKSILQVMERNKLTEDILRNKRSVNGSSPIHILCTKVPKNFNARTATKLTLLLSCSCSKEIVNNTNDCQKTPLHLLCSSEEQNADASRMKNVQDLMVILIGFMDSNGINQLTNDVHKRTALHLATISEFPELVKILVEQGDADLTIKDAYGKMAIHYAAQNALRFKSQNCVKILANWESVQKIFAAKSSEPQDLFREYLIWNSCEEEDGTKSTVLTMSCKSKSTKTVDFLLKNLYHAKKNVGQWFLGKDNDQEVYNLKQVYKYTPEALQFLFDKSVRIDLENSSEIKVMFVTDLSIITALGRPFQEDKVVSEMKYLGYAKNWPEEIQEKLLLHPVTQCALHAVWTNMFFYKLLWLLTNIVWLASYWILVPYAFSSEENKFPTSQVVASWILAVMSLLHGCNELVLLKACMKRLLAAEMNTKLSLLQIVLTWGAVYKPCLESIDVLKESPPNNLDAFCAASGILLSFILVWRNLGIIYLPIGTQVEYLIQTLKKILQSLICVAAIIVGFLKAFHQILPKHFPSENIWAFTRTLVMMTGELEYTEIFEEYKNNDGENGTTLNDNGTASDSGLVGERIDDFETWGLVMFILFVIILPVTFYNLVTGVVVDKIKTMKNRLEMYQVLNHIRLINYVQRTVANQALFSRCIRPCYASYRINKSGEVVFDQDVKWFVEKYGKASLWTTYRNTCFKSSSDEGKDEILCANFLQKKIKEKIFEIYEKQLGESDTIEIIDERDMDCF